jgi:hypothetical protein
VKLWTILSVETCSTVQYSGCLHLASCLLCLVYDHGMETEYSPRTTFCNTLEGRSETNRGFWVVLHAEVIAPFDWGDTEDYQRGSSLSIADKDNLLFLPQKFPVHVIQPTNNLYLSKAALPLFVYHCFVLLWDIFLIWSGTTLLYGLDVLTLGNVGTTVLWCNG